MSKDASIDLVPRAKFWLEVDGEYVFGFGVYKILLAIEQTGSIKEAATVVGKSYRHVWARLKEVEEKLGTTLVETQVGGATPRRSQLTHTAKGLMQKYQSVREEIFSFVEQEFSIRTNVDE